MPKARRGRGEGSIYQRTDGKWCATLSVGYAANGRRRRQTLFGATKGEVQDKLAGVQMTLLEGTFVEPSKLRVGALSRSLARGRRQADHPSDDPRQLSGDHRESHQAQDRRRAPVRAHAAARAVDVLDAGPRRGQSAAAAVGSRRTAAGARSRP